MLIVAVSSSPEKRKKAIEKYIKGYESLDRISADDSRMSLLDLESYVYPSLFSFTTPIVTGFFLLDAHAGELDASFVAKLVESPTVFILEEHSISTPHKKVLTKAGAEVLLSEEKTIPPKKVSPLFRAVEILVTSSDRKQKWLTLQEVLKTESAEALIGIWYWKLRDSIQKDAKKKNIYLAMYTELISLHARAWVENIPLGLLLEKMVLQK